MLLWPLPKPRTPKCLGSPVPESPFPNKTCCRQLCSTHSPSSYDFLGPRLIPQHLGWKNAPLGYVHTWTLGHAMNWGFRDRERGMDGQIMKEGMAVEKETSVYQH